jgi:hypothetical protein
MNVFLKLPKGQLSAMVRAQRAEELKKKLADPPAPLFREVRELIVRKCVSSKRMQIRGIFDKQSFGELERLVTQKLLDVTKGIVREELNNESWLRNAAKLRRQSYEELRAMILEFLETEVLDLSIEHCSAFLDPVIDSWDIDLKTFAMEIILNERLAATQIMKFQFVEVGASLPGEEEPGLKEFLRTTAMSGDATAEELEFIKSLRFRGRKPSPLYFYRELQSLRDPLHFPEDPAATTPKRRDAGKTERLTQIESRKKAIRRWARNSTRHAKSKPF